MCHVLPQRAAGVPRWRATRPSLAAARASAADDDRGCAGAILSQQLFPGFPPQHRAGAARLVPVGGPGGLGAGGAGQHPRAGRLPRRGDGRLSHPLDGGVVGPHAHRADPSPPGLLRPSGFRHPEDLRGRDPHRDAPGPTSISHWPGKRRDELARPRPACFSPSSRDLTGGNSARRPGCACSRASGYPASGDGSQWAAPGDRRVSARSACRRPRRARHSGNCRDSPRVRADRRVGSRPRAHSHVPPGLAGAGGGICPIHGHPGSVRGADAVAGRGGLHAGDAGSPAGRLEPPLSSSQATGGHHVRRRLSRSRRSRPPHLAAARLSGRILPGRRASWVRRAGGRFLTVE